MINVVIGPIKSLEDAWRALDRIARALNELGSDTDTSVINTATTLAQGKVKVDNDSGGDPVALTAAGHGAAASPHSGHAHLIAGKVPASELPALPPGPAGPVGASGPAGPSGANGISQVVLDGKAGPWGFPGPTGPPGPQGPAGSAGPSGGAGPAGPYIPGRDGAQGKDGFPIPGPQGPAGSVGPAGPQGIVGPGHVVLDGKPGPMGFMLPGPQGLPGAAGSNGAPGATGAQGPQGPWGMDGKPGPMGFPGPPGVGGLPRNIIRLTADNGAIAAAIPTTAVAVANLQQQVNVNEEWDVEWILHIANSIAADVFVFNVVPTAGTFTGRVSILGQTGVPTAGAGVVKLLQGPAGTITTATANAPGNTGTIGLITTVRVRVQGKQTVAAGLLTVQVRAGTNAAASSGTATVKTQSQMIATRLA